MTTRRTFLGALAGALGTAGASAMPILERQSMDATDIGLLVWCIDTFGPEAVAEEIVRQNYKTGARGIKRALEKDRRRKIRHRKAAQRRERHAGDVVIYRGPLSIHQQMDGREVTSSHAHRVLVSEATADMVVVGIGQPDGSTRSVDIPRGSRILVDTRRGTRDIMGAEVVETASGDRRLHIWSGATADRIEDGDTCPELRGGTIWESNSSETTGLLGLPLQ